MSKNGWVWFSIGDEKKKLESQLTTNFYSHNLASLKSVNPTLNKWYESKAIEHGFKNLFFALNDLKLSNGEKLIDFFKRYQSELYATLCQIKPLQTLGMSYQKLKIVEEKTTENTNVILNLTDRAENWIDGMVKQICEVRLYQKIS